MDFQQTYYLQNALASSSGGGGGFPQPPAGPVPALPSEIEPLSERQQQFEDKMLEVDAHVAKMVTHVATTSAKMANEFQELSTVSSQQLTEMLAQTEKFSNAFMQSAAFDENATDSAIADANAIISNIQCIHKNSEAAQRLLYEAKGLSASLGALEQYLLEMEIKRGIVPANAAAAAAGGAAGGQQLR